MLKGIKACSNTFWEALWPIIVSALDFGSIGPGSNPGRCQCVAFLSKTLHSHSTTLPGTLPIFRTEKSPGHNGKFLSNYLFSRLFFQILVEIFDTLLWMNRQSPIFYFILGVEKRHLDPKLAVSQISIFLAWHVCSSQQKFNLCMDSDSTCTVNPAMLEDLIHLSACTVQAQKAQDVHLVVALQMKERMRRNKSQPTHDKWSHSEQQYLVQLWVDQHNQLERINGKFGTKLHKS